MKYCPACDIEVDPVGLKTPRRALGVAGHWKTWSLTASTSGASSATGGHGASGVEQLKKVDMNETEQRIAIAEACGWRRHEFGDDMREGFVFPDKDGDWHGTYELRELPDYLHDLNAMHEAEKWLKEQPDHEYSRCSIEFYDQLLWARFSPRATAAQRAEAFLRTIGKWKEP